MASDLNDNTDTLRIGPSLMYISLNQERLALLKEKRELEIERRRGLCSRCSQSQSNLRSPLQADSVGKSM